jgi:hypothetical protein
VTSKKNTDVRTAIVGAVVGLAGSVALGIFQEKLKTYMLSELEHMPKPSVDRNNAKEFFSNRDRGKAIHVIDVLTKNLEPSSRHWLVVDWLLKGGWSLAEIVDLCENLADLPVVSGVHFEGWKSYTRK